ncbi:MAG: hypothetical protein QM750_19675 [Rubrivivax sp.]
MSTTPNPEPGPPAVGEVHSISVNLDEPPRTEAQWDELRVEVLRATTEHNRAFRRATGLDLAVNCALLLALVSAAAFLLAQPPLTARLLGVGVLATTLVLIHLAAFGAIRPFQKRLGLGPFADIDPGDFDAINDEEYEDVYRACNASRLAETYVRAALRQGFDLNRFELHAVLEAAAVEEAALAQEEADERLRERRLDGALLRAELATGEPFQRPWNAAPATTTAA